MADKKIESLLPELEFEDGKSEITQEQFDSIAKTMDAFRSSIVTLESNETLLQNQLEELKAEELPLLNQPVSVVFPYVSEREHKFQSFARWMELQVTLRSMEKNFTHPFKVVVVGDLEPWMDLDKIHFIESPREGANPPLDIARKMQLVIADEQVSDDFIWMNDDIVFINKVSLADIQVLKAEGQLKLKPDAGKVYQKNKNRTIELLQSMKLPVYDYSTHTPMMYNKDRLAHLIEEFKLTEEAHLISSLYFNFHFREFVPIQMDMNTDVWKVWTFRSDANLSRLPEFMKVKKWFNYNNLGLTEPVKKILLECFPDPSSFELTE